VIIGPSWETTFEQSALELLACTAGCEVAGWPAGTLDDANKGCCLGMIVWKVVWRLLPIPLTNGKRHHVNMMTE
jgi:hypothetical protein